MPRLTLQLPILQNWSCHNCGGCCKQHAVFITEEERARIAAQGWGPEQGVPVDQPLFETVTPRHGQSWSRLAQLADGSCVFLNEQGLCRIHARFGEPAKPLACQIYPYAFHPAGPEIAVSLRFSCPSVAANRGTPVEENEPELLKLAAQVVPANFRDLPPPEFAPGWKLDWASVRRIVSCLDEDLSGSAPLPLKLIRSLHWLQTLGSLRGKKLKKGEVFELVDLLRSEAESALPELVQTPEHPTGFGMAQFRLLAGTYARVDTAATSDRSWSGRFRQFVAAGKLASGRGHLPRLHESLAVVPFSKLEPSFGPAPWASELMLIRYFRVKLQGFHFCGKAYYNASLLEGFQSLALVWPVILWLARWHAVSQDRSSLTHADILHALTLVDHQHGYSEAFGTWGFRRRVKNLAGNGDLERLVVWYDDRAAMTHRSMPTP